MLLLQRVLEVPFLIWDYDWNTRVTMHNNPSSNLPVDLYRTVQVLILIATIHLLLNEFLFERIALKFLSKIDSESIKKFETACWKLFLYSFLALYGILVMIPEWNWLSKPHEGYYPGWKQHEFKLPLRFYYILEFANYLYGTIYLFHEPRLKDFREMLLHHIVTLLMISGSYLTGYFHIGTAVMLIHDISDPFMEAAKLFFYTGNQKCANILFAIFALLFIYTRDYVFPFVMLLPNLRIVYEQGANEIPFGMTGCLLLLNLVFLHFIWTFYILKIAYMALIHGGVKGDIREEKESY